MKAKLTKEEKVLNEMTKHLIDKLQEISEMEYSKLCFYP